MSLREPDREAFFRPAEETLALERVTRPLEEDSQKLRRDRYDQENGMACICGLHERRPRFIWVCGGNKVDGQSRTATGVTGFR